MNGSVLSRKQYHILQVLINIYTIILATFLAKPSFVIYVKALQAQFKGEAGLSRGRDLFSTIHLPLPETFASRPSFAVILTFIFIAFCAIAMWLMLFEFTYTFSMLLYTWYFTGYSKPIQMFVMLSAAVILAIWYVALRKRLRDAALSLRFAWLPVVFPVIFLSVYWFKLNSLTVTILLGLLIMFAGTIAVGAAMTQTDVESQLIRQTNYGLTKF